MFLTYYLFVLSFLFLGFFISCFFVKSKKAIVISLVIFFFLYMFWILRDTFRDGGEGVTTAVAFSPIGNISQVLINYILVEGSALDFTWSSMDQVFFNYRARTYFIIIIIEIIILLMVGLYCFYVVPLGVGVTLHPLFFCGYKKKKGVIKHNLDK